MTRPTAPHYTQLEKELRYQIEAAQREIDMWWPAIPQGPLYERIRRIHELEVARDE